MSNKNPKHIVILGAGFAGITAALRLAKRMDQLKDEYDIILIDRHRHQLYTPSLYQIAAVTQEDADTVSLRSSILIGLSEIFAEKPVQLLTAEVTGFRTADNKIFLRSGDELEFAFLIIALGSETAYFGIPGLKEHSFPLKNFDDALRLRNAIEEKFSSKSSISITIGGAGASGVELAAEFTGFICELMRESADHNVCNAEFDLIEASPGILPGFPGKTVKKTATRLRNLGVTIRTSTKISGLSKTEVIFENGEKKPYDIFIWTGGVTCPEILKSTQFQLSPRNEILTDEYLRARESANIFAAGDNGSFTDPRTNRKLPWNVPIAEAEGRLAAENIIRSIRHLKLKGFSPFRRYPFIIAIGKKYAIADLIFIQFSGILGWYAKALVELRYLMLILPPTKALKHWIKSLRKV